MKKMKKIRTTQDIGDNEISSRIQSIKNRTALVKLKHEEFMSQNTQSSAARLASQTLDQVQFKEETGKTIQFNATARKHYKKKMTEEKYILHVKQGYCGSTCKCLKKARTSNNRKHISSIFNLYVILFLGLRVNNDDVQLGDILRWCREGHLSFGTYSHLFPEDMHFSKADRFRMSPTLLSHSSVLKTAHIFAKTLKLAGIKAPDFSHLVKRYIEELELPHELYGVILRIIIYTAKIQDFYASSNKEFPNYEAMALSYIIIALKMLFGLDGVSENKISCSADNMNTILNLGRDVKLFSDSKDHIEEDGKFRRLFVWRDWIKYIEYRKVCLKQCHYPTRIRLNPNDSEAPELFLHHRNKTRKEKLDDTIKNATTSIIKSLLQKVEDNCKDIEKQYPVFACSLTPMASYIEDLLSWQYLRSDYSDIQINAELLSENFSRYNVSYLINPTPLANVLKKQGYLLYVHKFPANSDLTVDNGLKNYYRLNKQETCSLQLHKTVQVLDCSLSEWDKEIWKEKICNFVHTSDFKGNDLDRNIVILNNTRENINPSKIKKKFNEKSKKIKTEHLTSLDLHTCFENYWIRHYPSTKNLFNASNFNDELDKHFPPSFAWLLNECASVAELTSFDLYKELCKVEKLFADKIALNHRLKSKKMEVVNTEIKSDNESDESLYSLS